MHLVMPWFLPMAAGVAFVGTRLAKGLFHREGRLGSDGLLMLTLAWFPLLMWIIAQFTATPPRHP